MPYIGNTVQTQGFAPAIDYFNGNGVTVTFTLSRPVASVAQLIVAIDNVIQNPSSSFTVAGNAITFTSAPLSGTNNIWVEYTSLITTYQGISQDPTVIGDIRATGGYLAEGDFGNSFVDGTLIDYVTGRGRLTVGELDDITFYHGGTSARSEMMDLYYAGGAKIYGTTALTIPVGTTAQRPGTPATGMLRYNTTNNVVETYNGTSWIAVGNQSAPYNINFLVIAGGGGGGSNIATYNGGGGGGGAGGYRTSSGTSGGGGSAESPVTVTPGQTYTITVGAGGAGGANQAVANGSNGNNSVFDTITSVGGGGGAKSSDSINNGVAGGSGGGTGGDKGAGGAGTSNQGYAGGARIGTPSTYGGSGGGGAGAAGVDGASDAGTAGGAGVASSITGSSVTRAGGGGGGGYSSSAGAGGSGGGGAGGSSSSSATSGTANTGSGGGGVGASANTGGTGGSGVVILSMLSSAYSGITTGSPTVSTSGANTILTFTTSGTYTA